MIVGRVACAVGHVEVCAGDVLVGGGGCILCCGDPLCVSW